MNMLYDRSKTFTQHTNMRDTAMKAIRLPALIALAAFAAVGCAQDLEDINRVQPNYVKKADLLGKEFYAHGTVVKTQFTTASTFPGAMGGTVRGVFQFQENSLFFYKTYEFIAGSEVYAQKSDADEPMKDKDGNVLKRAVLQDGMTVPCTTKTEKTDCMDGAWCANPANPKLYGESDNTGRCVMESIRYVYRGAPVFIYPITSHFDILRGYSAASGEKNNVLSENTTDREWYQREFARISWGAGWEARETNPSGLDGEVIFEGDGAPEGEGFEVGTDYRFGDDVPQTYITFAYRLIAKAPSINVKGWWGDSLPICLFYPWYSGGIYDCISEEVKQRQFFLQVPQFKEGDNRKFVPRDLDDVELEKFGYFRAERRTYSTEYGNTYSGAIRRANQHRIWDRYVKKMVKDKDGNETWSGDFDYSKMSPTPIVYYLNETHPRELVQAAVRMAQAWSEPFEEVVAYHKGGCGTKKGADYEKCMKDNWPKHPMYVLCENSDAMAKSAIAAGFKHAEGWVAHYSGTDIGAKFCRNMDTVHQFGDLRYSTLHAVPNPIQIGLYGYGPTAADPLTGETIAGFAHSYTAAMKRGAEAAMRTIEFAAGIKDFNDIKRQSERKFLLKAQALKRYGQSGPTSTKAAQAYVKNMIDPQVRANLKTSGVMHADDATTWGANRMAAIRTNKALEAKLIAMDNTNWVQGIFKDPRVKKGGAVELDESAVKQMSLATWGHIAGMNKREKVKRDLAQRNIYLAEFADTAILGLAKQYGTKFDEAFCKAFATSKEELVFNWDKLLSTTEAADKGDCATAGEWQATGDQKGKVCKKIGDKTQWVQCSSQVMMQRLRVAVNTARGGSPFAEPNKFLPSPLYTDTNDTIVTKTQQIGRKIVESLRPGIKQELWARIYEGTQLHELGHTLGLRHNFEASTDTLNFHQEYWSAKTDTNGDVVNPWQRDTPAQAKANIREKMLASVMDYTAKFNGRFAGLGHYDHAAIKFAYGNMVEVFNNPPDLTKSPKKGLPAAQDFLAEPSDTSPGAQEVKHLGNDVMNRLTRKLHYSSLPKYFGNVKNMYDRRNVDWKLFKGKRCETVADCGGVGECAKFGSDKYCKTLDEVEVPYRFCSDEYNRRTPTCSTWDEGADELEIARNYLDNYEQYWYFYGYAGDSVTFHPNNYSGRVYSYFAGARRQLEWFTVQMDHYSKGDWWKKKFGTEYDQDPNGGLSGALAAAETTNKLGQVIGRPAPGYYCYNSLRKRFEPYDDREQSSLTDCQLILETDGARRLYGGWDFAGYSGRPVSGGQIYDRLWAFVMLADPTPSLWYFKVNQFEDARRYLASPFTLFPKKILNLLSGVGTENSDHYGWCVLNGGGSGKPDTLEPRHLVGGTGEACAKACEDFAKVPADKQVGCRKYYLFPDARPTFPSSRFRMPLLGNLYGMAMTTRGYDRSYMDTSRIFLEGHYTEIDIPKGVTKCTFTDPLSGKIYVAPKVSEDLLNPGCMNIEAAQSALDQFNNLGTLQNNYLFSEYQFRVSLLEVLRAMHDTYESW